MKKVIEMAREAGWKDLRDYDSEMRHDFFMGNTDSLERFAELVRADAIAQEREACIRIMFDYCYDNDACEKAAELIRARGNT